MKLTRNGKSEAMRLVQAASLLVTRQTLAKVRNTNAAMTEAIRRANLQKSKQHGN